MINLVNNVAVISNEKDSINIEFLKDDCLRIYKNKVKTDLIELCIKKNSNNYSVVDNAISYKNYKLAFDKELNISLYKDNKFVTCFKCSNKKTEESVSSEFSFDVGNDSSVYGLGDKMAQLDKKGYAYRQWNTDDSNHQDELFPSLYKSINYLLVNINQTYFGVFFPSTYPYTVDIGKTVLNLVTIQNIHADLDFFLFLGENPQAVTSSYSALVGHPFLIRMKMLGNNQSRWSYGTEQQVLDVANGFIKNDLPLDYIHLDINYMDGYRDFTVDKVAFPNMKGLTDRLKEQKIETVCINDSGLKADPDWDVYKFCDSHNLISTHENKNFIGVVWPGDSIFPKYYSPEGRKYFAEKAEEFIKYNGFTGFWNDMNEPVSFKGELPDDVDFSIKGRKLLHIEEHNVYAEHMMRCFKDIYKSQNLRPYIFSRAAFATTPKYAFAWNGDNFSLWHHLRLSLTQIMSMSLSGNMFNGVDIGGFGGDSNKELLLRWIEANCLMPFCRNHSTLNSKFQEPYTYDDETLGIYRHFLQIRYELIPYLYDLAVKMNKNGEPMVKPLFFTFPNDKNTQRLNSQYMVGNSIMVAPILDEGCESRIVYFPQGNWIDYETGATYKGNKEYIVKMPLGKTGIYVRANSIIPCYRNLLRVEKDEIKDLVLKLYGKKGNIVLYEDDGTTLNYQNGEYSTYKIVLKNNILSIKCTRKNYQPPYKNLVICWNGKTITKPFSDNLEVNLLED